MAVAAPLVIPAAEALWTAIVAIGALLSARLGISLAKEAIDKNFSDAEPSAVQPCPVNTKPALAVPYVNDPEAAREHDAYKQIAAQPPPPDLDECERLRWMLNREQKVVDAMEKWDAKWLPGRHAGAISERKEGIKKLKNKIAKVCPE